MGHYRETCRSQHGVFAQGFYDGALGIAATTTLEVEARYPEFQSVEVTLYLNGAEDGARGDRFRLDMECGLCGNNG